MPHRVPGTCTSPSLCGMREIVRTAGRSGSVVERPEDRTENGLLEIGIECPALTCARLRLFQPIGAAIRNCRLHAGVRIDFQGLQLDAALIRGVDRIGHGRLPLLIWGIFLAEGPLEQSRTVRRQRRSSAIAPRIPSDIAVRRFCGAAQAALVYPSRLANNEIIEERTVQGALQVEDVIELPHVRMERVTQDASGPFFRAHRMKSRD